MHNTANKRLYHTNVYVLVADLWQSILYLDDLKTGTPPEFQVKEIFQCLTKTFLNASVSYTMTHHIYLQVYLYSYDQSDAPNPGKIPFWRTMLSTSKLVFQYRTVLYRLLHETFGHLTHSGLTER